MLQPFFKVLFALLYLCFFSVNYSHAIGSITTLNQQLEQDPAATLEKVELALSSDTSPAALSSDWFELKLIGIKAHHLLGHYERVYEQVSELLAIAEKIDTPGAFSKLKLIYAQTRQIQNQPEQSVMALNEALQAAPENDLTLMAELHNAFGWTYRYSARYEDALSHIELAIAYASKLNDEQRLADSYNHLGILYDYIGQLELAIENHEKSLKLQKKLNNPQGISTSLYNIGEIYRDQQKFSLALTHFVQALEVDQQLGNPKHIANSLGKIGIVHWQLGNLALAEQHILRGLAITREMKANSDTAWQLANLTRVQLAKSQLDDALSSASEALQLATAANAKRTERTVRLALIDVYIAREEFALAETQIEMFSGLSELGMSMRSELLEKHSMVLEKLGKTAEALSTLKLHLAAQQQLHAEKNQAQSLQLQKNIELIRQQQQVSLLKKEQALQQARLENLTLQRSLIVVVLLFIIGMIVVYHLRQKHKQKYIAMKQKMADRALIQKNQLLADISHELRTPLTALKLTVEAMQYKVEPDEELGYKKVFNKITQLETLISDLYASSKFDKNAMSMDFSPVNLTELVTETTSELSALFDTRQQQLRFQTTTETLLIFADKQRLKQVLINLLRNAHFYTDPSGHCEISVTTREDYAVLTIEDSAPSVASEELTKIFERLYRCESSRNRDTGGSGLGLAICKQVVEAHHGTISASHSNLGGLKVTVHLPRYNT
ncbi:ATP-binding protein [Pseudoalteromonas sp. T1lg65]|uniref:ATP-binding protein n=1 Tax=Pseudoalteromonas sp. T1lg65 TaxID=2077101 RepID=UPI003F7A3CBD